MEKSVKTSWILVLFFSASIAPGAFCIDEYPDPGSQKVPTKRVSISLRINIEKVVDIEGFPRRLEHYIVSTTTIEDQRLLIQTVDPVANSIVFQIGPVLNHPQASKTTADEATKLLEHEIVSKANTLLTGRVRSASKYNDSVTIDDSNAWLCSNWTIVARQAECRIDKIEPALTDPISLSGIVFGGVLTVLILFQVQNCIRVQLLHQKESESDNPPPALHPPQNLAIPLSSVQVVGPSMGHWEGELHASRSFVSDVRFQDNASELSDSGWDPQRRQMERSRPVNLFRPPSPGNQF